MVAQQVLEEIAQSTIPPYVPYRTFRNFIDALRASGVPARIDRSVLATMSGATQGQLIAALRFLNLITANGTPTGKLEGVVKEGPAQKQGMRELLMASYPFLFGTQFNLKAATPGQLSSAFAAT